MVTMQRHHARDAGEMLGEGGLDEPVFDVVVGHVILSSSSAVPNAPGTGTTVRPATPPLRTWPRSTPRTLVSITSNRRLPVTAGWMVDGAFCGAPPLIRG